jgi:hypothetical protein
MISIEHFKKDKLTFGEALEPAMKIDNKEDAKIYLDAYVASIMKDGKSQKEATEIAKSNLGYFAGYYSAETREQVERLFDCAHPIFGKIAVKGQLTPEEAFEMGKNFARGEK